MSTEFTGLKEFVIDSLIGEGGMGKVYRARQVALDRWVALKVLTHAKGLQDYIGRFYREARSAARLVHPNIIQIYTVGEHEGIPFYAMELVEGVDLQQMIRSHPEPLSTEESLEIVRCVAKALGVCGRCVRDQFEQAAPWIAQAHGAARRPYRLPQTPDIRAVLQRPPAT
jgi:serine/threonine protein kinase